MSDLINSLMKRLFNFGTSASFLTIVALLAWAANTLGQQNFVPIQPKLEQARKLREEWVFYWTTKDGTEKTDDRLKQDLLARKCLSSPRILFRGLTGSDEPEDIHGLSYNRFRNALENDGALVALPFADAALIDWSEFHRKRLLNPGNDSGDTTAFVKFSSLPEVAARFSSDTKNKNGVIVVYYGAAIDFNCYKAEKRNRGFYFEQENVVPGLVYSHEIVGFIPLLNNQLGNFIKNPEFDRDINEVWPAHKRMRDLLWMQAARQNKTLNRSLPDRSRPDEFTLMTFNISSEICMRPDKKSQQRLDTILDDVDFLFTQESKGSRYLSLLEHQGTNGAGTSEAVAVYKHPDYSLQSFHNRLESENITVPGTMSLPARHAVIAEVRNGIKIANIQLAGGTYDDDVLLRAINSSAELVNRYLDFKLSLLKKVVERGPDIILGDFNSVFAKDKRTLESFLESQMEYFEGKFRRNGLAPPDALRTIITKINQAPYEYLEKNGYTYAHPHNEPKAVTNCRGSSIVDSIWYKKDRIELHDTEIVEMFPGGYRCHDPICPSGNKDSSPLLSDHNPVKATVRLK